MTPVTDLFGVGAVLYYAVEGRDPQGLAGPQDATIGVTDFENSSASNLGPLGAAIDQMLSVDPASRPWPRWVEWVLIDCAQEAEQPFAEAPTRRDLPVAVVEVEDAWPGGAAEPANTTAIGGETLPETDEPGHATPDISADAGVVRDDVSYPYPERADDPPAVTVFEDGTDLGGRRLGRRVLLGVGLAAIVAAGGAGVWAGIERLRSTEPNSAGRNTTPSKPRPGTLSWSVAGPLNVGHRPVVADGVIIIDGGGLLAVRVADGSTVWQLPGESHQIALADGMLYVQQGTDGQRTLSAMRVTDGSVQWTTGLAHSIQAMTVVGGVAYYIGSAHALAGSATLMQAVDVRDGQAHWTFTQPLNLSNAPVVDDTTVYVGGVGALWAVDRATGAVRWQRALPPEQRPSIRTVTGGLVLARGSDGTYALDPSTGDVRWKLTAADTPFLNSPAGIADGQIYTSGWGTATIPDMIRSVRVTDGTQLWQSELTTGNTRAIVYRSIVYASGEDTVVAAATTDGRLLWRYELNDTCQVEPVGAGDVVIVPTGSGKLLAIHVDVPSATG